MKRVLFRAPVLTQSGYGVHSRAIARWLLSRSDLDVTFQPLGWGDTPWILDAGAYDGLIGEIFKRTAAPSAKFDVTIQLQLPNEWDPSLGDFNVGMTAGVETDRCNPTWIDNCDAMDLIIVPSMHAKASLSSGDKRPSTRIEIVPESFSDACLKKDEELPRLQEFSTPFNFLVFGQITGNNSNNDRKNTFNTLKWLFETFKGDSDVGVVIKTNSGRNTLIDRNKTSLIIRSVIDEIRQDDSPRVHLLHGDMSDDEVAALYRHPQVKALVSPTRGEGFGLPILEAAASGLPIAATGWSGHMDFLQHGRFIEIFYQLIEVHKSRVDDKIFMKGSRWANPSEHDFKKRMTKFRSSFQTPKDWALDLQDKVRDLYSFESISRHYDDVFKETL